MELESKKESNSYEMQMSTVYDMDIQQLKIDTL